MKRFFAVLLSTLMLLSVSAFAFEGNVGRIGIESEVFAIQPREVHLVPRLSFSGATANCSITITEPAATSITAVMTLLDENGNTVHSWSKGGTTYVFNSGTHSGCTSGKTYTLTCYARVDGTVYYGTPVSVTCP